uniref:SKA complex subunit 1 homolog n=2 Tax=Triticinae TaxID=1648030 RepID=A0A8R7PDB0_TRIUA
MEAAAAAAAIPGSSSLEAVATAFRSRVNELQDLALARNMYPATAVTDLTAVDTSVTAMEAQVQAIRRRLQEELDAIPKAKKLVEKSLKQQQKLQHMLANMPPGMREDIVATPLEQSLMLPECFNFNTAVPEFLDSDFKIKEEPVAAPKKGKGSAPRWYISTEELDSLSSYKTWDSVDESALSNLLCLHSIIFLLPVVLTCTEEGIWFIIVIQSPRYMRGRLTLEKVNISINEVATYADANAHLVACPKKKLSEDTWEKALELRDIAATEAVKGKHFFLEADIKGPGLKLDHTGKAILTVLRHLGRVHETRIGHHRVFILSKQC